MKKRKKRYDVQKEIAKLNSVTKCHLEAIDLLRKKIEQIEELRPPIIEQGVFRRMDELDDKIKDLEQLNHIEPELT